MVLPSETGPSDMAASAGNKQNGTVGQALPDLLVVTVSDRQGQPVPGVSVAFAPADDASGTVSPNTATTDSDGHAAAQWTLGSQAGAQTVNATIPSLSTPTATFTATANPGAPNAIAMSSGDNQSAAAGTMLPAPLVVIVIDQFGNPVQGVNVSWSAQNGGSVSPETSTTGADGLASTQRTLGSGAGTQITTAASSGLNGSPVTFTHSSTSGPASALQLVSGNSQTGPAGAELPDPLVVRLVDAVGNPISGSPVSWIIGVGGGSVVPSGNTDANGQASARFTLGPTAGATNTVSAVVSGIGLIQFTAKASGGGGGGGGGGGNQATTLRIVAGDGQTADAGSAVSVDPSVKVTNDAGQGIAGFEVTFVVTAGNGSVTGSTQTTNSNGVATVGSWVLGDAGENRLEARATGLNGSPAVFTATANPVPTHLVFRVQPSNPQVEDRDFSPPVEVATVDAGGNLVPLSGLKIQLSLTPSSGRLRGGTSKNTDNGVAVFDDLRVDRDGDGYVLTASAPDRPALGTVTSDPFDVRNR